MSIQFDQAKDAKNTQKHGVSLAAAAGFEWLDAVTWPDQRRDHGEARVAGLGYIGDRLFDVVFVVRQTNHQPAKSEPTRGETLCRNLNRPMYLSRTQKMPRSPLQR